MNPQLIPPQKTFLQGFDPMPIEGGINITLPSTTKAGSGVDPMDIEAGIISSINYVEERREEIPEPRPQSMSANMYTAAKSNDVGYFQRRLGLLPSDADFDVLTSITLTGKTVAHVAAIFNSKEVMEAVCTRCEALLTMPDNMGATPLHEAASHGHAQVVELLAQCARGSSKLTEMLGMRKPGTAMELAVVNDHLEVVKVLASVEPRLLCPQLLWPDDKYVQSALDQASVRAYWGIVDFILSVPIALHYSLHFGKDTPLHWAIAEKRTDIAMKLITEVPGFASMVDCFGNYPLHLACGHGLVEIVGRLLQINGGVVYKKNNSGRYPNHEAAAIGHIEIYKELVGRFPDIEDLFDDNGENALHIAIKEDNFELVQHILETTKNNNLLLAPAMGSKATALHIATYKELMWIVFLVLDDERTQSQRTLFDNNLAIPADIIRPKIDWGIPFSQKVAIWWALTNTGKLSYSDRLESLAKKQDEGTRTKVEKAWKSTTNTLLLVDSLIATVSFAAIFTLPGGYEEKSGLAKFRSRALLLIFVLIDSVAMFSSMLSAIIIIVANWADYKGLLHVVPWAFITTSISFVSMCAAFVCSIILTMKYSWALLSVLIVKGIMLVIFIMIYAFQSPYYAYWRVYVFFRRMWRGLWIGPKSTKLS